MSCAILHLPLSAKTKDAINDSILGSSVKKRFCFVAEEKTTCYHEGKRVRGTFARYAVITT